MTAPRPRRRLRAGHLALALLPLALSQAYAAPVVATWAGTSGNYGLASNWDIGAVPVDNGATTYAVQIVGANHAVGYSLTGAHTIDSLALDAGSSFNLSASSFVLPTDLTVNGKALIAGAITADNASFTALGAGTNFAGTSASVSATNGGVVKLAATSYNARGLPNQTFLHAAGAGSLIQMTALKSIDVAQGSGFSSFVTAEDSGRIDLSGVQSLVAPNSSAALVFTVNSGGSLDLGGLKTIAGPTTDTGYTRFNLDGASATLGGIQSANRMSISLANASTLSVGGYAGSAALTNSTFAAAGASTLDGSKLVGTLVDRGLANQAILSAAGAGSFLDLSGLTSIDVAQASGFSNFVNVTDKATLKLSGVKTLVSVGSNAALAFTVSGGANLDMSGLQTVSGPTTDTGYTTFALDGASATLGALQSANRLGLSLANASTLTVGGYSNSAALTNSIFSAAGGSTLNAATLRGTLTDRGLANQTIIAAAGAGTRADLSGLSSIDVAQASGFSNFVSVTDKATLNLSGVKTLVATNSNAALAFSVSGGASLDMSGLQTVSGPTQDTGHTTFTIDGATATLGALQSANRLGIAVQNAATLSVGGYAGTAVLTDTTFSAASGASVDASRLVGTLTDRGLANQAVIAAAGAGSFLDLSGLTSVDVAQGSGFSNFVNASDKARIDLSGVKTLVAPSSNAALQFNVSGGADLKMTALQTVSGPTAGTGTTAFALDGASATLGPLQKADRLSISLANGSTLAIGGYAGTAALTDSRFAAAGGSQLNAASLKGTLADSGLANATLVSATGAGTVVNLSGLRSLDSGNGSGFSNFVSVSDHATLNLSGLQSVVAPSARNAQLVFGASSGGHLDLSSLTTISNPGGGLVAFNAASGGSITLAGITAGPAARFSLTDAGSALSVLGNFTLQDGSVMSAGAGTTIRVGGNFSFAQTVESTMNLDAATLAFSGSNLHTLEVGGEEGIKLTAGKAVTSEFAIGQLDVGQAGAAASVVQLTDAIDNGNRHSPEALYLNGTGGASGLNIQGGSTLALNNLDLWVNENGTWDHVNDKFTGGVTRIAYGNGFIVDAVPEPSSIALLAAGLGLVGWRARRRR